jgi:hypothetical protein
VSLGHHVRLPFSSSHVSHAFSHVSHAFDLIHCDVWTSHVLNISGYKYYLVVIDNFSPTLELSLYVPSLTLFPPSFTLRPSSGTRS